MENDDFHHQNVANTMENERFELKTVANTVEMAVSSSKMLQIAWKMHVFNVVSTSVSVCVCVRAQMIWFLCAQMIRFLCVQMIRFLCVQMIFLPSKGLFFL